MLLMLAKRYLTIHMTEGREAADEFEMRHLNKDPELHKQLIPVIHNLMTNKN